MPAPCKFRVGEIVRYTSLENLSGFCGRYAKVIDIDMFDGISWRLKVKFFPTGREYKLFERRFESVEQECNPVHIKIKSMFERQSYYKNKE